MRVEFLWGDLSQPPLMGSGCPSPGPASAGPFAPRRRGLGERLLEPYSLLSQGHEHQPTHSP